jgi:predicted DNA-binding protein (UPF0251 family)
MARPQRCRKIKTIPGVTYYKPRGIPLSELEEVTLTLDEYEAMRLADFDGLYQDQAAAKMSISRQTFGRIVESAHRKISDVLLHGKALKIEGGSVAVSATKESTRVCKCLDCTKKHSTHQS